MITRNRKHNLTNPYQNIEKHKRVLCVCTAGLLRSPTMAVVLSHEPFNYNTRAAGLVEDYALIPVDEALCLWADLILAAHPDVLRDFQRLWPDFAGRASTLILPDRFTYMDPELVKEIKDGMKFISMTKAESK